ncbi:kinase-like domain-containing protein [Lophiotrema nucula]|uniref:non-specific serine/threonine protein kinase n=1 Tax=Lophiotrema nucula TaxID=690887 RepID=A0A6A5ZR03_9PLEO|nr:kinase-like domain-containing protein [Lophiotrema nucula]
MGELILGRRMFDDWQMVPNFDKGVAQGTNNNGIFLLQNPFTLDFAVLKRFQILGRRDVHAAEHEIEMLDRIDHPNVTRMLDWFINTKEDSGGVLLEFCDKRSLADLIVQCHGKFIEEDFLWHIFETLADVVCYFHNGPAGLLQAPDPQEFPRIAHHDLKPENILLSSRNQDGSLYEGKYPRVVVADLGVAMEYTSIPQFITHEEENPFASDIFQLGFVMYCLSHPEEEHSPMGHFPPETMKNAGARLTKYKQMYREGGGERYSTSLNHIMKKCLRLDPKKRPLAHELLRKIRQARQTPVANYEAPSFSCFV